MNLAGSAVAADTLSSLALQFAVSQLGQSEVPQGSNKGPMVDKYLASVGLRPGNPWCMAFFHWCYRQAANQLGCACLVPKTGLVMGSWNSTPIGNRISRFNAKLQPDLVKPGAQFVLSYGGGLGHTGMVERIEGNVIHTIEGNSNDEGGREGFEVCRRERHLTDSLLKGFINY